MIRSTGALVTVIGNVTITQADVDADYGFFTNNLGAGTLNAVGGIMPTHKLNKFTMQEAINWYPRLKAAFSVQCTSLSTS